MPPPPPPPPTRLSVKAVAPSLQRAHVHNAHIRRHRCPTDDVRRWPRRRRRPATRDRGRGRVSAGHQAPGALVGREEGGRWRHRVGHNRRLQLSDRLARLRHAVPGRRRGAHRYTNTTVASAPRVAGMHYCTAYIIILYCTGGSQGCAFARLQYLYALARSPLDFREEIEGKNGIAPKENAFSCIYLHLLTYDYLLKDSDYSSLQLGSAQTSYKAIRKWFDTSEIYHCNSYVVYTQVYAGNSVNAGNTLYKCLFRNNRTPDD